jgi:hypothetical protein
MIRLMNGMVFVCFFVLFITPYMKIPSFSGSRME